MLPLWCMEGRGLIRELGWKGENRGCGWWCDWWWWWWTFPLHLNRDCGRLSRYMRNVPCCKEGAIVKFWDWHDNFWDFDSAMAAVLFLAMLDWDLFGSLRQRHWEIRIDEGGVMVFSGEAMPKNWALPKQICVWDEGGGAIFLANFYSSILTNKILNLNTIE